MGEMIKNPNGTLVPSNTRYSTAELVESLQSVLMSPYTGKDEKKKGLTKAAAAFLALAEQAQDGDAAALNILLDRLIGKPTQQIQSLNLTASLSEFLGKLATEMDKENIIDIEVDPLSD